MKAITVRIMKHESQAESPLLFRLFRRIIPWVMGVGIFASLVTQRSGATTFSVDVGLDGLKFSPKNVSIQVGDTVKWTWRANGHSVTSGTPGFDGLFDSGVNNSGHTFSHIFLDSGTFTYFCMPHGACCGMVGSVTVAAAHPPHTNSSPTPHPDTGPDRSRPGAERLYQVGCGNRR